TMPRDGRHQEVWNWLFVSGTGELQGLARRYALKVQRPQKLVVPARAIERMLDALLLDVTGLAIDVRNARQQASEIEHSGAELRVSRAVFHDVLEMEAPIAVAVALEISERIAASHRQIADVELVTDDSRVRSLQEQVVRHGAVDRLQVIGLVVEREPNAGAPRGGAGRVEAIGPLAPIVQRPPRVRCEARHDQVLVAHPLGDGEASLPPDEHDGGRDVRRGRA